MKPTERPRMQVAPHMAREMVDASIDYSRTYTAWRTLMDPSHQDARFRHQDFLLTTSISLLLAYCIYTFQLFDNDRKTKSLRSLVGDLRKSDARLAGHLTSTIDAQQPVLDKVIKLRHNVYAHRNRTRHTRHFFADVKLTPRQMKVPVQLAEEVAIALAAATGVGTRQQLEQEFCRNTDAVLADTMQVMQTLHS